MCQAVKDLMHKGAVEARLESILNAMDNFHFSIEGAFQVFQIPEDERAEYIPRIRQARYGQKDF